MKLLLIVAHLCLLSLSTIAQSLDYISVRKKNGRVIKNFYSGSQIVLQAADGTYLEGPITAIRNDSVFIRVYDVRYFPTTFGTFIKDTVSISTAGIKKDQIQRVLLTTRRTFLERTASPLLMIGGAGYLGLNILNGAFFNLPVTDKKNIRTLGIAAGAFGVGYLLRRLFSNNGFSRKNHRILYIDL